MGIEQELGEPEELHETASLAGVDVPEEIEERLAAADDEDDEQLD